LGIFLRRRLWQASRTRPEQPAAGRITGKVNGMSAAQGRPAIGGMIYFLLCFVLGSYFAFAAVQGDYGVFRQVEIRAETEALQAETARLEAELAQIRNRTLRLSDSYLDLDLLDEQVRDVLGYVRADEIVIR
jgi:cell division protein FtsB